MLLLAATADAKMGAARHHALRAIIKTALDLTARILTFFFRQRNICAFSWQQTCDKQCLTLVTRHPLSKRIEVRGFNSYDLTRRHASFCRVELRHRRDCSQINIISLIVP